MLRCIIRTVFHHVINTPGKSVQLNGHFADFLFHPAQILGQLSRLFGDSLIIAISGALREPGSSLCLLLKLACKPGSIMKLDCVLLKL